jgi:hypothetical protein
MEIGFGSPPPQGVTMGGGRVGWVRGSRKQLWMSKSAEAIGIDGKVLDVAAALCLLDSGWGEDCKMWSTVEDSRIGVMWLADHDTRGFWQVQVEC